MKDKLFLMLVFFVGLMIGSFGTLAAVIHIDTKRVLSETGPTTTFSMCGFQGKAWPTRSDGMCYMDDMPGYKPRKIVQQSTTPCASNVIGDNNVTTATCGDGK